MNTFSGMGQRNRRMAFSARRSERGASLVEYAFVVILFLSLIFGVSGFGHALFVYHHLNNAAREASRYAAVRGFDCNVTPAGQPSCTSGNSASGISGPTTKADVLAYVKSITPQSIDPTKLSVFVCGVSGQAACAASGPTVCTADITEGTPPVVIQPKAANFPGCTVSVQVAYPYSFIFPLLPTTTTTTAPCTKPGFCLSSESQMVIVH
jgi:Flp pilus assembly protein TadG